MTITPDDDRPVDPYVEAIVGTDDAQPAGEAPVEAPAEHPDADERPVLLDDEG